MPADTSKRLLAVGVAHRHDQVQKVRLLAAAGISITLYSVTQARFWRMTLRVRRASKVAQALWLKPERALRPGAQSQVTQARAEADALGILVEFQG